MLRIAICDNDASFIKSFSNLLELTFIDKGCEISIQSFLSGINLIESIEKQDKLYDVIFLDVKMPGIDGFEVAKRLRQQPFQHFYLIFTTFMENEWAEGYVHKAYRFILKKCLKEDVEKTITHLLADMNPVDHYDIIEFKTTPGSSPDHIKVLRKDILYFEKEKGVRRIWLYTVYGKYGLLVKNLTDYEAKINSKEFGVFVRSHLVNMSKIEGYSDGFFTLTGDVQLSMGSSKETIRESKERYLKYLTERI